MFTSYMYVYTNINTPHMWIACALFTQDSTNLNPDIDLSLDNPCNV